jgi:hypothetical protein
MRFLKDDATTLQVDKQRTDSGIDFEVDGTNILAASMKEKAGSARSSGSMTLDNEDGRFTSGSKPIHIKDKVTLLLQTSEANTKFGVGPFGTETFGGTVETTDYMVTTATRNRQGGSPEEVEIRLVDYVTGVMSDRDVDFTETRRPISGSPGGVLNQVLRDHAPEIDRSKLPDLPQEIDYFAQGKKLNKVIGEIADIAAQYYGPIIFYGENSALRFVVLDELVDRFDTPMTPDDFAGEPVSETSERGMVNNIRVVGGIDDRENITDEQTQVDDYVTVSPTNRLETPLETTKSEISRFEVYTYAPDGSGDEVDNGVRVRIQIADKQDSAPKDPTDDDADIINSAEQKVAYETDGFTGFLMGQHNIPDREIWMIIDSKDGPAGYDVGVQTDADGNVIAPAFKAHFPKPVGVEKDIDDSVDKYGQIDGRIQNDALATGEAVRSVAEAKLSRSAYPTQRFEPELLDSARANDLDIGDKVTIKGYEDIMVQGQYVVSGLNYTIDGFKMKTEATFEGVDLH